MQRLISAGAEENMNVQLLGLPHKSLKDHTTRAHLNTPTQELKLLLQINFEAIKLFFGFKHFLVL